MFTGITELKQRNNKNDHADLKKIIIANNYWVLTMCPGSALPVLTHLILTTLGGRRGYVNFLGLPF